MIMATLLLLSILELKSGFYFIDMVRYALDNLMLWIGAL